MAINVLQGGLSTTVQDLGRPGYYHIGIPISGGMDRFALRAANMLVGNDEGAAVLEATFMGPELEFTDERIVAVTGAELAPKIGGAVRPTWTAFKVRAGETLSFDLLKGGARAYIAISGGIDVPVVLGSRSTYTLGALGGYKGRKIDKGDTLEIGASSASREGQSIPESLRRRTGTPAELRTLPGLYAHRVTEAARQRFFADTWKVAPEADRIGYRFRGGTALSFVRARAALRRRLRSFQHRRCLLPLWLDPGAGRHRAHRLASRCRLGRRLFHARHRHLGRHGQHRPDAAAHARAVRRGRHGDGARGAARAADLAPEPAPGVGARTAAGLSRTPGSLFQDRPGLSRAGADIWNLLTFPATSSGGNADLPKKSWVPETKS